MTLEGIKKYSPAEAQAVLKGQLGFDVISDGDGVVTGSWWKIRFTGNTTIAAGTVLTSVGDDLPAASYVKGDEVIGPFNSIDDDNAGANSPIIAYRY